MSKIKEAFDEDWADSTLDDLLTDLQADDFVIALTDKDNFRKDVLPSYKDNRKQKRKPMVLNALREYVIKKYNAVIYPKLEADDVLGILSLCGMKYYQELNDDFNGKS